MCPKNSDPVWSRLCHKTVLKPCREDPMAKWVAWPTQNALCKLPSALYRGSGGRSSCRRGWKGACADCACPCPSTAAAVRTKVAASVRSIAGPSVLRPKAAEPGTWRSCVQMPRCIQLVKHHGDAIPDSCGLETTRGDQLGLMAAQKSGGRLGVGPRSAGLSVQTKFCHVDPEANSLSAPLPGGRSSCRKWLVRCRVDCCTGFELQ